MGTPRKSYLRRRRKRREELGKLRQKYRKAKTSEEKEQILEKMTKIAPHVEAKEFIAKARR